MHARAYEVSRPVDEFSPWGRFPIESGISPDGCFAGPTVKQPSTGSSVRRQDRFGSTGALASAGVSVRYGTTGVGQPAQVALYRSGLRALPEARAEWPLDRRRMDQADCDGLMLRQRSRTHALWRCIAKDIATTHGSRVCRSRVHEPNGSWGVGRVFAGHTA